VIRGDLLQPIPASLEGAAALIVMGGPMGVHEQDRYRFLADEVRLIQEAVEADVPILGVCLGSQLLAAALGATVRRGSQKEIGWHAASPSLEAATDPLFIGMPNQFQGFLAWRHLRSPSRRCEPCAFGSDRMPSVPASICIRLPFSHGGHPLVGRGHDSRICRRDGGSRCHKRSSRSGHCKLPS